MYVIFKITPYSKYISRSILKKPKYYFYDIARVLGDGARIEILVACSLIKETQYHQDCLGENWDLYYLAKKGAGEIDFLITKKNEKNILVEVKLSDDQPSKNFHLFKGNFPKCQMIQLVHHLR